MTCTYTKTFDIYLILHMESRYMSKIRFLWHTACSSLVQFTVWQVLSGRNDFSKTKLWHKTISPHSMLIGHANERGMARVSDPTSTIELLIIPCHTAQYFLEYTTESCQEKKSQSMGLNNTRTVGGIPRENHDFENRFCRREILI